MSKKILIVGGVAGGASTAARLRRLDEKAEIIMFEKGEYISFANCGLPYYIGETIEDREALLVQTPEAMNARFNIDVRVQNEVLSIDKQNKSVEVMNLKTGEKYIEDYDVLVLSPGSTPLKPPIPGIDSPNIFTLWNIPDTDAIKSFVDNQKPKRAAVIGGGFIGLEMAENLHQRGIEVSVIEMADQVMAPIDFEMAQPVQQHMRELGVHLYIGDGVKTFEDKNGVTTVTLQSGKTVDADMVMLSIGVRPQTAIAKEAGLELNQRGGIIVDEHLRTSDENIYAIGDAVEIIDFNSKQKTMVPLAGPANKQGRICADNICGFDTTYKGTQGTSIAKIFEMTVASTGVNEKTLIRNGKKIDEDYKVVITHSKSNAGYYPGAIPMTIKLVFGLDGKVLGAQIVGYDGVDKRIDVIAASIRFGATVYDLTELELAYAPPYSSAKDPVNMAGYVAENILTGKMKSFNYNEFDSIDKDNTIILDIRAKEELELGYIDGSINIPLDTLRDNLDKLDKDKKILVYCAIGLRGYIASRILTQNGFENVYNISGGYATYACVHCQDDPSKCGGVACNSNNEFSETGDIEGVVETGKVINLNACGMQCPGPILQVFNSIKEMDNGDVLEVKATDPGFTRDIRAWCNKTGNTLLSVDKQDKTIIVRIMKGKKKSDVVHAGTIVKEGKNSQTMVVFSDDLDKVIASLIIANGAAAMGKEVTMFYTFWGLNVLRKEQFVHVEKDMIAKMFSMMMPRGTKKLGLSKMNMMGMGAKMIRNVMKKNNVDSLETLLQSALDNGVKMIACNMSMTLMGIDEKELIDGIDLGGVATYLGEAEDSNINLFI